jgi:hypothetical protein
LAGDIVYAVTNNTTWEQNYNSNYISNYDNTTTINNTGWTINQTDVTVNNTNVTEVYEWGSTSYTDNYTTTYDNTTTINLEWDTNVSNLNVSNITFTWWGMVSINWTREYEETLNNITDYMLINTPISEKWFMVFVDSGTWLFPTTDYTYNTWTQTITFSPQLWVTEHAIIRVMVWSTPTLIQEYTEEFIADWILDDFTLTHTYISWWKVYLNWLRQKIADFTIIWTTLHFNSVPPQNTNIIIDYVY